MQPTAANGIKGKNKGNFHHEKRTETAAVVHCHRKTGHPELHSPIVPEVVFHVGKKSHTEGGLRCYAYGPKLRYTGGGG